jgi:geranylgeranyl diphosphate synthase type II
MIATFENDLELIDKALECLVPSQGTGHQDLYTAARYSLLAPGKRIRPLLALATGKMFGAKEKALLQPACALEMIHAYSLIHDDLPAIDNDDFRRGKPSLHKVHGEDKAILAGDFLLTYAFEILSEAPLLTDRQRIKLISTLAKASGGEGMIGGQIMDLSKKDHDLKVVNGKKTGALLTASILFGGIVADVSEPILALLKSMGEQIGLLFQVCDDILDQEREEDLEQAHAEAHSYYKEAVKILTSLPGDPSSLNWIFKKIILQI